MEKLTSLLRQTRESKNLSLTDAEIAVHIPSRYLRVLEGGEEHILLADKMYLIPYLRAYATFLGLNPAAVVNQFVTELQAPQMAEEGARAQFPPASSSSRFSSLTIPFLLLFALLGVYTVFSRQGEVEPPPSPETKAGAPSVFSSPPAASPALPEAAPAPAVAPPLSPVSPADTGTGQPLRTAPVAAPATALASPETASPAAASHLLKVRAKAKTWIRVTIDGQQPPKDVVLEPGQETEWSAQKGFLLTLGNAGGIAMTLDGEDVPPPGKPGQVVRDLRLPSPAGVTTIVAPIVAPPTAAPAVTPVAASPPPKRQAPPKVKASNEDADLKRILESLRSLRRDIQG